MIWIILFIIVVAVSAFFAYRSMRSFQELPSPQLGYTLFLVNNLKEFTLQTLDKLFQYSLNNNSYFSLEVLFKGPQVVLAIFAPKDISGYFQNLGLIEIEDYLLGQENESQVQSATSTTPKTDVNHAYAWLIQPKNNLKKKISVSENFFRMLDLKDNQKFFWQVVASPVKNSDIQFQVTIRAMVEEADPNLRVELAKEMDREINSGTGLLRQANLNSNSEMYNNFKKRTLIPKEVRKFILQKEEIYDLLGKVTH